MGNQLEMRFLSVAANVGLARLAVAQMAGQAGFSLNDIEEIKVAISEAVSNAMIHGYLNRSEGWILVECKLEGHDLQVAVEDWGTGIADVEQARQPAYSSDPERMGLGFVFMESFMNHVIVRSHVGRGTRVEMMRSVKTPAVSQDAQ